MEVLKGFNWVVVLGIIVAVETQIGNGTMSLANMVPEAWIPAVKAWAANLGTVGALIMSAGAFGQRPAGQFTVTPAVKPAIILAALVAAGALLTFPGDAHAQIRLKPPVAAAPTPRVDPLAKLMDDLAKVQAEVVDGAVADINAADQDAAKLVNPADPTSFNDPISHACYPAAVKFLQSLPTATPPTGKFILVQLFQKKRDFVAQVRAGLPVYLKLGCSPLLGDEAAILTKLLGLVGVQVGLNALAPGLGLAMPAL